MPVRAVDALQEGFQADPEHLVVLGTAQPARGPELHILYPARRTGQSRQLVRRLAEVLADQGLEDRRQIQLLLLRELVFLGTDLAQVENLLLAVLDVRQMHGGRTGAKMAIHAAFLRERARAAKETR